MKRIAAFVGTLVCCSSIYAAVTLAPRVLVTRARMSAAVDTGHAFVRGDVNRDGAVTSLDVLAVLSRVAGRTLPGGFRAIPNGDANCDGVLSVLDAQIILSAA